MTSVPLAVKQKYSVLFPKSMAWFHGGEAILYPKNPDPSRKIVGLMVSIPSQKQQDWLDRSI